MSDDVRRSIRPLSDLNLIDNFLFSTLMENPEIAEKLVKIILKRTLGYIPKNISIESQKHYNGIDTNTHGIHIDVLVKDYDNSGSVKAIYDIEPNAYREKHLAKRNRFYNALIDTRLLNSGDNYSELPDLITIWILPYDPFGNNKIIYTIKNIVTENPDIVYNDGIKTIILNASAAIDKDGALEDLLNFMINSDIKDTDSELAEIQAAIHSIKGNPEVGENYMSIQSAMYYEKKMSFEEGEESGFKSGFKKGEASGFQKGEDNLVKKLIKHGFDKEAIEKIIALDDSTKEQPVNN
ncbi:MAG: Rpn family recombination-promoting nuclease/putative transposase [Lachnospiraceae bacterium]|nr:Rpn family recombination-promoting nuclease/putative transposase [Lachnospiraceae bacterium]